MLAAGGVLIVVAAIAAGIAWWQHRKLHELVAVDTSTCADLRQLADAVNETEEAAGAFSQRCELVGAARPANGKALNGPFSGDACVWYRTKLTEKYWDWQTTGTGKEQRRERVQRERTLQESDSEYAFLVDDGTGQARIDPRSADIDQPQRVFDEFNQENESALESIVSAFSASLIGGGNTIGIRKEEWIVPVDARLFVQGEVFDERGQLAMRKPPKGAYRVSMRSEEELTKSASRWRVVAGVTAVVAFVAGVGLAVAGAVTG
ncbi:MAG: hypothetical protein QOJ07_3199 [Thermoleophilaceae bacterium]|nr:hypothetical protein [Thermoleophilaceae bacterium]